MGEFYLKTTCQQEAYQPKNSENGDRHSGIGEDTEEVVGDINEDGLVWTGRVWFIHNRACLPFADLVELSIILDSWFYDLKRDARKVWSLVNDHAWAGFTLFRDNPERWLELALVYTLVSNQDDWDRYEGLQWYAAEVWANNHPDDPDVEDVLERVRRDKQAYVRWGRETLGWAICMFRKSGQEK